MPQYLVAVYHRDDYDPSVEDRSDGRRRSTRSTAR